MNHPQPMLSPRSAEWEPGRIRSHCGSTGRHPPFPASPEQRGGWTWSDALHRRDAGRRSDGAGGMTATGRVICQVQGLKISAYFSTRRRLRGVLTLAWNDPGKGFSYPASKV